MLMECILYYDLYTKTVTKVRYSNWYLLSPITHQCKYIVKTARNKRNKRRNMRNKIDVAEGSESLPSITIMTLRNYGENLVGNTKI